MRAMDGLMNFLARFLMLILNILIPRAGAQPLLEDGKERMWVYDREQLEKELAFDEGKRLTPYKDSLGHWTVGIGHLITKREQVRSITEQECHQLFQRDLIIAERNLSQIFPEWEQLDDVRQRALINLSFNLGSKLSQFIRFLMFMRGRNFTSAGESLKSSRWYRQVGNRAHRIYQMIVEGTTSEGYPS